MRSPLRRLPKHLLDDIEEDCVIEYLALALALTWLVVSTAFCVVVGKCIASGLAGGGTRPALEAPAPDVPAQPADGGPAEQDGVPGTGEGVDVPVQRTSAPGDRRGEQLPSALPS